MTHRKLFDKPGLGRQVIRFARLLKAQGFRVFQSDVLNALCAMEEIDLGDREDFLSALRVTFSHNDIEWALFPTLFEAFWGHGWHQEETQKGGESGLEQESLAESRLHPEIVPDTACQGGVESTENDGREWLEGVAYSPVSGVEKKDLSSFDTADIQVARLALKRIMEPFRINSSRRRKKSGRSATLDFRRIMRKSLKAGGLPLDLFYREKKKRLKRLVVLADVSGSMDRYARFVMPFILGLRGIGSRAEVFVFSTSLASISSAVRRMNIHRALERIVELFPDWSGGTRIGYSLHQFNKEQGARLLNKRTVVLILSDGWDLGGKDLLRREMAALSRMAHCVIWLNPLAGDPDYEPVCGGMRVALPYVDYFMPANSLESLKRVGLLLSKVMVH